MLKGPALISSDLFLFHRTNIYWYEHVIVGLMMTIFNLFLLRTIFKLFFKHIKHPSIGPILEDQDMLALGFQSRSF